MVSDFYRLKTLFVPSRAMHRNWLHVFFIFFRVQVIGLVDDLAVVARDKRVPGTGRDWYRSLTNVEMKEIQEGEAIVR